LLLLLIPESHLFSLVPFPAERGPDKFVSPVQTPLSRWGPGGESWRASGTGRLCCWQGGEVRLELRVKGGLGRDDLCFA